MVMTSAVQRAPPECIRAEYLGPSLCQPFGARPAGGCENNGNTVFIKAVDNAFQPFKMILVIGGL